VAAPDGGDGPFPVPSPHAAPEGFLGAPAESGEPFHPPGFFSEATGSHGWHCYGGPGCNGDGESHFATPEAARADYTQHVAAEHASTPPAAPVPASHRPEVAGEPESGQDGTAGRVAVLAAVVLLRGREFSQRTDRDLCSQESNDRVNAVTAAMGEFCKALPVDDPLPGTAALGEVHDAAVRYAALLPFDSCDAECRMTGTHSLRPGGCEHATPSEPTVSLSRVYTDPGDGHRFISFSRYTVADLAELIEPALREVGIRLGPNALAALGRGEEVRLTAGEYVTLALAAADAIVTHSNRETS
jgi:hypothetical protein